MASTRSRTNLSSSKRRAEASQSLTVPGNSKTPPKKSSMQVTIQSPPAQHFQQQQFQQQYNPNNFTRKQEVFSYSIKGFRSCNTPADVKLIPVAGGNLTTENAQPDITGKVLSVRFKSERILFRGQNTFRTYIKPRSIIVQTPDQQEHDMAIGYKMPDRMLFNGQPIPARQAFRFILGIKPGDQVALSANTSKRKEQGGAIRNILGLFRESQEGSPERHQVNIGNSFCVLPSNAADGRMSVVSFTDSKVYQLRVHCGIEYSPGSLIVMSMNGFAPLDSEAGGDSASHASSNSLDMDA